MLWSVIVEFHRITAHTVLSLIIILSTLEQGKWSEVFYNLYHNSKIWMKIVTSISKVRIGIVKEVPKDIHNTIVYKSLKAWLTFLTFLDIILECVA